MRDLNSSPDSASVLLWAWPWPPSPHPFNGQSGFDDIPYCTDILRLPTKHPEAVLDMIMQRLCDLACHGFGE